jgi:hypothetical protein
MAKMKFEDLEVWKRAAKRRGNIYKELRGLEDCGFKDQITGSRLSIPLTLFLSSEV